MSLFRTQKCLMSTFRISYFPTFAWRPEWKPGCVPGVDCCPSATCRWGKKKVKNDVKKVGEKFGGLSFF